MKNVYYGCALMFAIYTVFSDFGLDDMLSGSGHAYACQVDGVLDMRTISLTRTAAGEAALWGYKRVGVVHGPDCGQGETCDCVEQKILPEVMPNAKIVSVKVEVIDDEDS